MSGETDLGFRSHPKTARKILELLGGDFTGKKIIDLGAGQGAFTRALAERIRETGSDPKEIITACDLFPESYRFPDIPCEQVDFTGQFPYADAVFDTVVSIEVIEHLSD